MKPRSSACSCMARSWYGGPGEQMARDARLPTESQGQSSITQYNALYCTAGR